MKVGSARAHPDRRSRPVTVIREGRRRVLVAHRQSEPSLDPEQAVRPAARRRRNVLRNGRPSRPATIQSTAPGRDSIGPGGSGDGRRRGRGRSRWRDRSADAARHRYPGLSHAAGPACGRHGMPEPSGDPAPASARRIPKPPRSLARRLMSVSVASTLTDSNAVPELAPAHGVILGLVRPPTIVASAP